MEINILKDKINSYPEETIYVNKKTFFLIFFRMLYLKDYKTLSDNEIELLASLCSDTDTSIKSNNLQPVIKKLNEKGLMKDKDHSDTCNQYKERFKGEVSMIMNFNILPNEG